MSTSTPDFVDPYKKIWESRDLNSLNSTPVELENNRSQFRRGLGAFGDEMQATGYGLAALGAQGVENIVGKNDITSGIRDWGLEGYNRNIAESQGGLNTPNVARVEDIKNASDAMDWASYQLGKGLPMLGSLALSGGIGGAIARIGAKQGVSAIAKSAVGSAVKEGVEAGTLKAVEGQVVTQGMKDAAAKLIRDRVEKGVLAGGFTGSFGLEGGQAFGEEVAAGAKPEDAVLSATAVGGINGLLEFLPLYKVAKDIGLGHYAKKKLAAEIMDDPSLAKKAIDLAGRVGKSGLQGAAEGAAIEGVTEGLQELVSAVGQRWATKEPLFADLNSDDWSRIGNAALAGGLVGGVAAGAGHAAGGLVSPQVKITNNQKENTTQAAEQPTLTRTQVLEAMRDKANSDIELATKVNDTAKVEELTKARDIYEEKLNEIKNNEQVLAEQPIIDNTQVSPETTPIKEDQQPASEDIFNKGFNELNTKVDNSQNIIEPKTSEVSGKQAGEDLSSEITTQPQLEQSHEERQAEVASLLSQEGDVTEANVPDVTSTPTNKVLLSQNISENDAEQEQLWKEFQAVKAQFEAKQSDKPAFDKWFGEGVEGVNKKDGKPVELYHGTNNPMFYQWDESRAGQSSSHPTSGLGFFMTADKGSAARYGSDLLKLHVKVEKPYYMTDTDLTSIESVQDATKFRENLKSQGYDSAVITAPGASPYVVAFNSNQVKLSDNTNPTSSPDFRYSRPQKEIKPTSITEVADKEYLDAIKSGDLAFAQKMVQKAAQEAGVPIINDNDVTSYKIRRSAPPVKTIKAYKLFRTKVRTPGEVFPLFVGANTPLPQGVWLDAVPGESAPNSKTGKQKVKSSLGPLAYRPGWHAGDLPLATHIGAKDANGNIVGRKLDEVWVEVEMAADKDYQPEANKNGVTVNGEFSPALADIKTMPTDGLYRYKTNPNMTGQWIISGSMKINRALSEDEVNKILTENNLKPMPWVQQQKGSKTWTNSVLNLNRLGLTNNPAINQKKLLDTITYDDNGNIIPLSKRFNPKITDPRYSNLVEKNNQNRFIDAEYNINSKLGDGWLQRAQDLGLVEVHEGRGPNNEAGSWDGNKIRMYLGSISEDSSPLGILLHEGKHATFKDVLGDSLESYVKDLQTIANTGNQSAQSAIKHAALAAAKTLGIKHDLTMGSRLADFNNIRALIEEKNPGLLSEEELAYFIQYGTETQSGRGFIRRLIEQIKAWFAQTEIGKKFKEAGLGFELNEAMAIEWAKEGLKQATNKLEQNTKEVNKTEKQLVKSPASARIGDIAEGINKADPYYSMSWQDIKDKLWTDPTDINQELINKPGLIQRLQADFVDYFSHIEKKAPELYDTYSLMRNKKGARIEQARQEYIEPLRQLIVNSPWTAAEVGDMLAARHIKLDSVNQNLAERASYDYTGKLLASLPKKEKAELKEARAFVKEGKMLDGKDYVDNKGNKIDMPEEVKRKMMFDLMNKYAPFEAKDSNGNQPITADWEIFKDAASGFSEGGIGKDRVRAVDDVLKRTSENQAQFDKIANMFDAANRAVLDILEYGGLITKSEHARLLADKSAYAPLRRSSYNIDSSIEQLLQNRGQGAGKSLGTRVGTSELSEPTLVVQNAMAKLGAAIASAEKNMANNELYDTIISDREGWKSWFTTNDKDTFATHDSDGFSHESKSSNLNPTDVVLIKNGKRLIIQPNLHNERAIGFVRAINNLDAQALNGPMKVLGWTNQLVRWVNVNASPAFLMMNAIRDPFTAAYNLQASEAAPYTAEIFGNYGASFRALKKVFLDGNRDQTDPDVRMVEKWENAGGRTSMIHDLKPMDESWRSFDAQVARRQGNMKQLMQVKDKWIDGLENFNLLFENVMRLSAFNTLVEKGVVSEKRAARIAQDLTTNFTRRGYKSQALGTWWLFFNATVQGNYQVLRNIISSKKVQIAAGGTIAFSLMMDILGRTMYPDDWDKRPEWDKERYITLPFKAYGDFLKIPAPWVYNVVWRLGSSIGEMQAGVIKPQDAMLDLAAMTLSTLSPVSGGSFLQRIAPTVADPFVQIAENKDFSGNPIGPEGYPGAGSKANSELLWNSTPRGYQEFARMINRATGGDEVTSGKLDLRPGDYQVLARFLTGSLGRFLSDSTFGFKDAINRGIEGPKDIPVVRELFSDPYNPMRSEKYHNNIASVYGAHKLENMYRAGPDRDLVKLHEVRTEKRVELSMFNQAKDVEKQIKSLRTQIRVAENRGDTERVKVLKDRMGQVQERFNKSFRSKMG